MKTLGIIILVIAFIMTAYMILFTDVNNAKIITLAGSSIFIGMGLILGDRITLIKLLGLGEIQAATEKALAEAKQIESIRNEVEDQKNSIDSVINNANEAEEQLRTINIMVNELSSKTEQLENTAQKADKLLSQIQSVSDFSFLLLQAKNDSRKAFETLFHISESEGDSFQSIANQAVEKVILDIDSILNVRLDPTLPWANGIDPQQLSFGRLVGNYNDSNPIYKPPLISFIWKKEGITKYQKLDFLAYVIKTATSLRALERACRIMNTVAKLNLSIVATNEYLSWWEDHKHEYQA